MSTPRDKVNELENDIFRAEGHSGDFKYLPEADQARIQKTALFLILEGWTK